MVTMVTVDASRSLRGRPRALRARRSIPVCVRVAYLIDKLGVSWASRVIIADGREVAV